MKSQGVAKVDLTKFETRVEPPEKMDDLSQWDRALDSARTNMEYSANQYQPLPIRRIDTRA